MYQRFKNRRLWKKYSKAVSEMYSQFKQKEAHPMEKYIGRLAYFCGGKSEVVGYDDNEYSTLLIVDASKLGRLSWEFLGPHDVVTKKCEKYGYVSVDDLID